MKLWLLWSPLSALIPLACILVQPPRSRALYTLYALVFGSFATFLIIFFFSLDAFWRAPVKGDDKINELILANSAQIAIVVTAMWLGGLATNLLVAGLPLPWIDRSGREKEKASRHKFALSMINLYHSSLTERLLLLPDEKKDEYVQQAIQSDTFASLLDELDSHEARMEIIGRFNALKTPRKKILV